MKRVAIILVLIVLSFSLWGANVDKESQRYLFYEYQHFAQRRQHQPSYIVSLICRMEDGSNFKLMYQAVKGNPTPAFDARFSYNFFEGKNRKYLDSKLTFKSDKIEYSVVDNTPRLGTNIFYDDALVFLFDLSDMPGEILRKLMLEKDLEVYIDMERLELTPSECRMIASFFYDFVYGEFQYEDFQYLENVRGVYVEKIGS